MNQEMSFEEFRAILAEELVIPIERLTPQASFINDLQVDSLALASMMLRLEDMGVSLPLESAWEIETIEDAYRVYLECLRADAQERRLKGEAQKGATPLKP